MKRPAPDIITLAISRRGAAEGSFKKESLMRLRWMVCLGAGLLLAAQVRAEEPMALKTQKEKLSYSIGVDVARNFRGLGIEIDLDLLMKGLKAEAAGGKLLLPETEIRKTMNEFQGEVMKKGVQARRIAALDNKEKGDAFLAVNKTKEGVVTLPSGLQYKVLKVGNGKKPVDPDTVECHYRGILIDGTEFDSSYRSGHPAIVQVAKGIKGWREALKLMPVGSKWQIFIPPQLAYGSSRGGQSIGPNSTLIYEVELLAIK
jgi:FKBP-type peptidyl-prolyl cis-trans isomerase